MRDVSVLILASVADMAVCFGVGQDKQRGGLDVRDGGKGTGRWRLDRTDVIDLPPTPKPAQASTPSLHTANLRPYHLQQATMKLVGKHIDKDGSVRAPSLRWLALQELMHT